MVNGLNDSALSNWQKKYRIRESPLDAVNRWPIVLALNPIRSDNFQNIEIWTTHVMTLFPDPTEQICKHQSKWVWE